MVKFNIFNRICSVPLYTFNVDNSNVSMQMLLLSSCDVRCGGIRDGGRADMAAALGMLPSTIMTFEDVHFNIFKP